MDLTINKYYITYKTKRLYALKTNYSYMPYTSGTNVLYKNSNTRDNKVFINQDIPKYRKVQQRKSKKYNTLTKRAVSGGGLIFQAPITFILLLDEYLSSNSIEFEIRPAIDQVVTFHDNMIKNHGVSCGTTEYNKIRNYCIALMEGRNPDPLKFRAVSKFERWPSALSLLLPLYRLVKYSRNAIADRTIRSILYLNRLCDGNGNIEFSSIEKVFLIDEDFRNEFKDYL
jgi:hypothetical protein